MFDLYQNCYDLKKILESDEWPKAVDDELLEPQDPIKKAQTILYMLVGPDFLPNAESLLDFGCGTGETTTVAREHGVKNAVGYDIKPHEGVVTNFEEVAAKGPYDVILCNDVLDHLVNEEIHQAIQRMTSVMKPEGRIFVRCHPFASRAGTHLPLFGINKAYAHVVFPDLRKKGEYTNQILHPLMAYQEAFKSNMLHIEYQLLCKQKAEDFFEENKQLCTIFERVLKAQKYMFQMRIQYAEFALCRSHTDPRVPQVNNL